MRRERRTGAALAGDEARAFDLLLTADLARDLDLEAAVEDFSALADLVAFVALEALDVLGTRTGVSTTGSITTEVAIWIGELRGFFAVFLALTAVSLTSFSVAVFAFFCP